MSGNMMPREVLGHRSCPGALREMPERMAGIPREVPVEAVLPPVTPGLEETLEKVLSLLEDFRDVRIIVNDWGTLVRVSLWKRGRAGGTTLVLGVLLAGQDSDPVIRLFLAPQPGRIVYAGKDTVLFRWAPPPETLKRHWAEPSAFHLSAMLTDMGVDEIETGLQAMELPVEDAGLPVSCLTCGVLSVQPCRGKCGDCGGREIIRAGCRVFFDRNLLLWEYAGNPAPGRL